MVPPPSRATRPRGTPLNPHIEPDHAPDSPGVPLKTPARGAGIGSLGRASRRDATARKARVDALVELLADDSAKLRARVRAELERLGRVAVPALQRATKRSEPAVRGRARQILLEWARKQAGRRLARLATKERPLESALFLLDGLQTPGADTRPYRRALDAMGDELRRRIAKLPRGAERIEALATYLGSEIGFAGCVDDYHHPDNIHVGRTIERRRGMPLTLCAIYLFVARRVGLAAGVLPLPGHVVIRVEDGDERRILDAFGGGRILSEAQCRRYLKRNRVPDRPEWLREATDTAMFHRHVVNLIHSLESRGRLAEVRALRQVHEILTRSSS